MERINEAVQVVYTNKAHCRDCHRCLRVCPVKAIRMEDGQAYVVPERCIACGTCVRECPQGAKQYVRHAGKARELIGAGGFVAASVAPSFAGYLKPSEQNRLAGALRRLGFSFVAETAAGAYRSAIKTAEIVEADSDSPHICSACPSVVSYVEKYVPESTKYLVGAASPMIAHARHLKRMLTEGGRDDIKVVFIGPCIAKKAEAARKENDGAVDCVLTFEELEEWFDEEGINLANCEESRFDESPEGDARSYPLLGGSIRASSLDTDMLSAGVVSASGFEEVSDLVSMVEEARPMVMEPLFCRQGCINGPGFTAGGSVHERRRRVLEYAALLEAGTPKSRQEALTKQDDTLWPGLAAAFHAQPVEAHREATEEQIQEVYESTGKSLPEDRLDCGACGYDSCREKAVAVIRGYAEAEMCMPYVKRLAQRRTDKILETSPNGIVMLDSALNIISMNPAFRQMFMCSDSLCGKPISYLMDPEPFEKVAEDPSAQVSSSTALPKYGLSCLQLVYALQKDRQYVGIFVDVTRSQANKLELDELRMRTVEQARQLMEHQIGIAQMMAKLIGESTAKGEALVQKLMELAGETKPGEREASWLKDIYTTK